LGLTDWRKEIFFTALHGKYLQDNYPDVEIGVSFPRIRPHAGIFDEVYPVGDSALVQAITSIRQFIPRASINISTRETETFRNNVIPLGVTKMSCGVSTEVGGHSSNDKSEGQFEISDKRSVMEFKEAIQSRGYQPVFKDWINFL